MSLLDDVSIVVTPNGYKAGTLYGVLPTAVEGSEEVTNGNFATDSDWTKGTGWTISGGKANSDGTQSVSYFRQNGIVNLTSTYKVQFTVSGSTSGTLNFLRGNGSTAINITSNNTYNYFVNWDGSSGDIVFQSLNFVGSVDNVSVKQFTASDMDVTRATAATRVDENGLVNYAEVLSSEYVKNGDFSNGLTDWSFTGAPSGYQQDTGSGIKMYAGSVSDANNALSKSATLNLAGTLNNMYKMEITASDFINGTAGFVRLDGVYDSSNIISFVTGTQTVYFTAYRDFTFIQFFAGSADATITVNSISIKETDRNNVPRIDYTGGGCPHILAEPQRTNLIPKSNEFSDSSYIRNGTTATTGFLSPDGTLNAYKLLEDNTNAIHRIYQTATVTGSPNTTISIYVKYLGRKYVLMRIADSTVGRWYDIENGVLGGFYQGTPNDSSIESAGNGWYRISITHTVSNQSRLELWVSDTESETQQPVYQGDTSKGVYLFGAQLEVGTYPTSYIPTSGSSVTRNADIFQRDGIASLIGQTEGTIFVDFDYTPHSLNYESVVSLQGTATTQYLECYFNSLNKIFVGVYNGGAVQLSFTSATQTAGNKKIAIAYKANDFAIYLNGTQVHTDNSGSVPLLSKLGLGSDFASSLYQLSQPIKQLQVYKTRLTNTQLAALTS